MYEGKSLIQGQPSAQGLPLDPFSFAFTSSTRVDTDRNILPCLLMQMAELGAAVHLHPAWGCICLRVDGAKEPVFDPLQKRCQFVWPHHPARGDCHQCDQLQLRAAMQLQGKRAVLRFELCVLKHADLRAAFVHNCIACTR